MFDPMFSILFLGLGLGLLHALDADHIMAVSALGAGQASARRMFRFSLSWALGHGGVLFMAGLLLFGLGLSIPPGLQYLAEVAVGAVLILLGLVCLWRFRQQRLRLVTHRHGEIEHTHWLATAPEGEGGQRCDSARHQHSPTLVGMLHGLAGSAPVLALVPAVSSGQLGVALAYLLLFSVGVMAAMFVFGSSLGFLQQQLQRTRLFYSLYQYGIVAGSIGLGSFWVYQAI